ncbi:hypothetical protein BCR44DRAFT_1429937 [Catenaria anguillulae PL171]|uniref:Uncharacterized protein n=1 Tax=Catenaria anguillulae PL171 TaxID=765915 RepID=A0A1Y2HXA9_9FUNG|nr:hypothetical protein BCR44DRAFT_1429937 [Catenaria anguillulae PL171]
MHVYTMPSPLTALSNQGIQYIICKYSGLVLAAWLWGLWGTQPAHSCDRPRENQVLGIRLALANCVSVAFSRR